MVRCVLGKRMWCRKEGICVLGKCGQAKDTPMWCIIVCHVTAHALVRALGIQTRTPTLLRSTGCDICQSCIHQRTFPSVQSQSQAHLCCVHSSQLLLFAIKSWGVTLTRAYPSRPSCHRCDCLYIEVYFRLWSTWSACT